MPPRKKKESILKSIEIIKEESSKEEENVVQKKIYPEQWLKKYCPKEMNDFVCFQEETKKMKEWIQNRKRPTIFCRKPKLISQDE